MKEPIVWCADIGSIKNKRFGWCRGVKEEGKDDIITGIDIEEFADGIAYDLAKDKKVAVGFECPLFVPISENPVLLTSARKGEGYRPWSAGAGCGALTTGLTECVWILNRIKKLTRCEIIPTFNWLEFQEGLANLFIWEAFVSKDSKSQSHFGDAEVAVKKFWNEYPNIIKANSVTADNPYNLVATALLRVGLTDNIDLLSQPCIVIKS